MSSDVEQGQKVSIYEWQEERRRVRYLEAENKRLQLALDKCWTSLDIVGENHRLKEKIDEFQDIFEKDTERSLELAEELKRCKEDGSGPTRTSC